MAAPVVTAAPYLAPDHANGGGLMCQGKFTSAVSTKNNLAGTTTTGALGAHLDNMLAWYTHVHSDGSNYQSGGWVWGQGGKGASGTTLAAKLISRGFYTASQYRNGTYTSQADDVDDPPNGTADEAASAETNHPLGIQVFWAGDYRNGTSTPSSAEAKLTANITAAATTLTVTEVSAGNRPGGMASTWPFRYDAARVATGVNAHSTDTLNYVPWVRVGDEVMILTAAPSAAAGVITLTVRRGQWGTTAADHNTGDKVLVPVYIGIDSIGGINVSGSPNQNEAGRVLRYALNMASAPAQAQLVSRISATFFEDHNGIWLDVSSSFPFNQRDAWDNSVSSTYVRGFDPHAGAKITNAMWGRAQRKKADALRRAFPGKRIIGNNLGESNVYATNLPLVRDTYDLSVFENFLLDVSGSSWVSDVDMVMDAAAGNWPVLCWARWPNVSGATGHADADVLAYKRYTYGSFLLAYRSAWTKGQYGGVWSGGAYASSSEFKPDPLFFFDLGDPVGAPLAVAGLEYGTATGGSGKKLHRRDYAGGIVVVNPNATGSLNFTLPSSRTWFKVAVDGTTTSASGAQAIGPMDGAFFVLDSAQTRTVGVGW